MFYCIQDDKSKGRRTRKKRKAKMGRFQGEGITPGECQMTFLRWSASEQIEKFSLSKFKTKHQHAKVK